MIARVTTTAAATCTITAIIGTTYIVCGAWFLKWYGVCPSVCGSMGSQQQSGCCRFAAVGPAGRRYQSIAAAVADECGQCHAVSICR